MLLSTAALQPFNKNTPAGSKQEDKYQPNLVYKDGETLSGFPEQLFTYSSSCPFPGSIPSSSEAQWQQ